MSDIRAYGCDCEIQEEYKRTTSPEQKEHREEFKNQQIEFIKKLSNEKVSKRSKGLS